MASSYYPDDLKEKIIKDNLVSCVFLNSDLFAAYVVTGPAFTTAVDVS